MNLTTLVVISSHITEIQWHGLCAVTRFILTGK